MARDYCTAVVIFSRSRFSRRRSIRLTCIWLTPRARAVSRCPNRYSNRFCSSSFSIGVTCPYTQFSHCACSTCS